MPLQVVSSLSRLLPCYAWQQPLILSEKMPTNQRTTLPMLGVGFLANALGLLTFILLIYLCLTTVALFFTTIGELARAEAEGVSRFEAPVWQAIGTSLAVSARNGLNGLWAARYGFLAFGALGLLAAWAHRIGLAVSARGAWVASFVCMLVVLAVALISWAFVQRDYVALWMAESPELYRWRATLTRSWSTEVSVSLIFALALSFPIWIVWQWWYTRLASRFLQVDVTTSQRDHQPPAPPRPQQQLGHRDYNARVHELKRQTTTADNSTPMATPAAARRPSVAQLLSDNNYIGPLAILLVLCIALIIPINIAHQRQAIRLDHDTAFVNAATQAAKTFTINIASDSHRLRVVNIEGLGTVDIALRPTADPQTTAASIDAWEFQWRADEYFYNELPIADVAPGEYELSFVQREGWGWFEYTLSHGGSAYGQTLALALGLLMAGGVIFASALLILLGARVYHRWEM